MSRRPLKIGQFNAVKLEYLQTLPYNRFLNASACKWMQVNTSVSFCIQVHASICEQMQGIVS